ncbi:hypothetical protein [Ollibium composti]|uniref:Uncharacterized protein n=1 Tax=Ollibium composti TaxID=2675109 RepID=A0ABY2QDE7_9HYPH|nr:hypothetical protein [Mesorhizobium composti]THF60019.1 hypothetical protein E6C48_02930 [Mesorhizobium composti]
MLSSSAKKKQAQQQAENDRAAAEQQYAYSKEAAAQQRAWDLEDRAEARAYSRQVYSHLVEDAEKAGFNPLTALRNGGGANYNAAAGFAPLSRQAPVKQAVAEQATAGAGAYIGESLSSAGANWLGNFDPYADAARESSYQLVQAQIRNLNASTEGYSRRSFNVPTYEAGAVERRSSGKPAALSASAGNPRVPKIEDPTVTNPWESWVVDPNVRDADALEQRYGDAEPLQWIYGLYTGARDIAANLSANRTANEAAWAKKWGPNGPRPAPPPLVTPNWGKPYKTNPVFQ